MVLSNHRRAQLRNACSRRVARTALLARKSSSSWRITPSIGRPWSAFCAAWIASTPTAITHVAVWDSLARRTMPGASPSSSASHLTAESSPHDRCTASARAACVGPTPASTSNGRWVTCGRPPVESHRRRAFSPPFLRLPLRGTLAASVAYSPPPMTTRVTPSHLAASVELRPSTSTRIPGKVAASNSAYSGWSACSTKPSAASPT